MNIVSNRVGTRRLFIVSPHIHGNSAMVDSTLSGAGVRQASARRPAYAKWSGAFLAHLASTSNVSAAARKADVSLSTVYEARRINGEFNRRWQQALLEGYEHLEMELLSRLRTGELKPSAGARRGVRMYDNATAFRLLSAHREAVARQRAIQDHDDAEAVLASIDAKLDRMRQRQLAACKAGDVEG